MVTLTPPTHSEEIKVTFPADHVLLLTMNRPKQLNAMSPRMEGDINRILEWFDDEVELWVVIITGEGRMFCAGADLRAWNESSNGRTPEQDRIVESPHGFGGISRRNNITSPRSCKPIIAAVNGAAHGGGLELALGCDMIVCGENAKFSYPEVKRGVVAAQGGIPRLVHVAGHQLAAELVLLGRAVSATDARDRFRFVNLVVPDNEVVAQAVHLAVEITRNSPDAIQSSRRALWDVAVAPGVEDAFTRHVWSPQSARVYSGDNIKEGIAAFVEKRGPKWKTPAKL